MIALPVGTRVQMHPATDQWMQGDRYGTIVAPLHTVETACMPRPWYRVKLDKSGKTVRVLPDNVLVVV